MQSELPSDTAQGVAGDDLKSSTAPSSSLSAPSQSPSSGRVVVTLADSPPTAPDDKTVIRNLPLQGQVPTRTSASPQHICETLIGKHLDHYEQIEFVGGGGMGAVFRANDTRLGRNVTVKVL